MRLLEHLVAAQWVDGGGIIVIFEVLRNKLDFALMPSSKNSKFGEVFLVVPRKIN